MESLTVRALTLYRRGLFGASWKEWTRLGQVARSAGSARDYLQALNGATACAAGLRLTDDALLLARRAVAGAAALPAGDPAARRALSNLAIESANMGLFTEAEATLDCLEGTCAPADDLIAGQVPLLRLNLLIDQGEFDRAADFAPEVISSVQDRKNLVRARHAMALAFLGQGDADSALPLLEGLAIDYEAQGVPGDTLALLTDLIQARAMVGDAEGVMSTHEMAEQLIGRTTCALNGTEFARVAALDAFGLAVSGEVRAVRGRLVQVRELLGSYGRAQEAERLAVRIVRFMAEVAGRRHDLIAGGELGRYLSSPYVAEMDFRRAETASLAAYVTAVGPKLAEVDLDMLAQAATSPLTARSVLLREMAEGRTSGRNVPPEAKVLSILRAYAYGTRTSDYQEVLGQLQGPQRRRFDQEIVERFVALHVA